MKVIARARAARARGLVLGLFAAVSSSLWLAASPAALSAPRIAGGAPRLIQRSTDLGPVAPSSRIEITLWLKVRDAQGLDNLLAAQHAGKAQYLSKAQIEAQYLPTATEVGTVSRFLKAQGFTVTTIGPSNFFVKASGTVGQVDQMLQVELHQYRLNDTTFRASPTRAKVPADIALLVASVGGLSDLAAMPNLARTGRMARAQANIARQTDAENIPPSPIPLGANPSGIYFSNQCFAGVTSVSFSGNGVTANYQGNRYGQSIENSTPGTIAPCGYSALDVQGAYKMNALYREGLDGTGETVAIVDAYGSTTIAQDLAAFSNYMGLPKADLKVIGTSTESNFSGDANEGWAAETTLDVEWVHAIAPRAKIILVVAPTNSFDDLIAGDITASQQPGVVTISNSWAGFEAGLDPAFQQSADAVFKVISAGGAALNFASGDSGDNALQIGMYDVGWPASSSYVTGVGGVSMVLDQRGNIRFQSPWGTNITQIADTIKNGSAPLDPPNNIGFEYGGGGGVSDVYPVPSFQRGLGGIRRQVPDIAWLADPYTGVEIIYSVDSNGDLGIEAIGGTSLATPMFSALWSIAVQNAGHPLGQAAPYLYELPQGAITDILPISSPANVTGTISDSNGTTFYDATYLALPLQGLQSFTSALYDSPYSTKWFVLMFGLDSTLAAGPGYDLATGLGAPNPVSFVQAFGRGGRY